jgi:hypothetical protein
MSETRLESELIKSLGRLDNILTKAQIEDHRTAEAPKEWGDGEIHEYDSDEDTAWQDSIEEDGTDYNGPKKSSKKKKKMKKAHDEEGYDAREDESISARRGAESGKKQSEKDRRDESYGKWGDREEEEEEGKRSGEVNKSVRYGVEVSEFLGELTKAIAIYCDDLENAVIKSIGDLHAENGEVVKALAHNLTSVSELVSGSQENIVRYADGPARGPKSMQNMSKSIPSDEPSLDKTQVIKLLVKGVEAGTVSPLEVIKCEQYGPEAVSQNIMKSLTA